jgi:cyclopropane fatty-acyl-phospholipid synthase-like methyltransferase
MFTLLNQINSKPDPFEYYTVKELWTDKHTSKKMLETHLDGSIDLASYRFEFIDTSVDWIESYFRLTTKSKVADFGCGPGFYTTRLAEKGVQVTGIDFSANSLDYAQQQAEKKALDINYVYQNYLEYSTQEMYDLIIMIMCDFCALSPDQRKKLLQIFSASLKPGGNVLLDVQSLHRFYKIEPTATYTMNEDNGFWSDKEYYEFLNIFKYDNEKVTLHKFTIIEEKRMFTIYNWMQYFNRDSIAKEFNSAGFQITDYFSNVAGVEFFSESDLFAVVAGKK